MVTNTPETDLNHRFLSRPFQIAQRQVRLRKLKNDYLRESSDADFINSKVVIAPMDEKIGNIHADNCSKAADTHMPVTTSAFQYILGLIHLS